MNETNSKKWVLFNRLLPDLMAKSAFFTLAAVKHALVEADIKISEDTLHEYMSQAMKTGIVGNAGRGWYSRHTDPVSLDPKPAANIIRAVKKTYPLLDFCCWSTVQFTPFAQHLIAQPTIFFYAESDTLETISETLKKSGWNAWANPGKVNAQRYVQPGEKTVVLRPSLNKQPESINQAAPIEKALIDLSVESHKLQLLDSSEVQRIFDNVLSTGLLQMSVLLSYAELKRVKFESKELTH